MSTLQQVELGVLGPLQVRQYGLPVSIPGAKPRAILTMLGLHGGSIVSAETLVELLWGDDPPRTAAKALPTHISTLRRTLGDGFVLTAGTGWALGAADVDATRYKSAAKLGREALAAGDPSQAVSHFDEALALWRDTPELPAGPRGQSERTRWIEGHAALVEDRADALLATGRAAEIIGELEAAISEAPLRERRWGQLMLALYRAGRQGEALGAYQRARSLLVEELGVDPGPDLRRLEAAIVAQDAGLEVPVPQQLQTATRTVTFLLTDIEGSTAAWEADADAMAVALARHDELIEQVVTSRGGRLVKTRGEGDATFSVFDRASGGAASAIELQEAIRHEPWALQEPMRIRVALHTGEVELRDGDYFGRAVNRAARLRSLAAGGQILCSGATAELVIDSLPDDVVLADLGMRQLKNLARPEHVFELRLETAAADAGALNTDTSIEQPDLPAVLAGTGPFVGRGRELEGLLSAWQTALATGTHAVLIAGEPGVGKTRLAGEWARQAHELGAVVLYGRCDEDLGAPYQPFSEALRTLVPCLGSDRLRGLRGVKALFPLIPGLADDLPDLVAPTHADADSERYALFDAVVALLGVVCASAPVVVILDDLHWAAKPTLLLLRHLLRFGEHAPVQIVGTYRSTDLDRAHPLAAMLADLHRDGSADRLALSGLEQDDITAYVAEAGYDDEELARALASVTGGNPFFLIEALRHVDESGGRWDPRTLPQGVREAVSRRLSRLREETNTALAAAAVVGSRFSLDLVERVTGDDLIDAFDEASKAGIVIEEPGGRYRFNHALVRQSLLAELASVRRMRLHQRIATTLEAEPGADEELLDELAYHYFECAWAGNAAKAVEYCRRAADQAMARLAYEGAADLYGKALHALDELDDELPNREDQQAELLIARCEALLAAGDVVSAAKAVSQLQAATRDSARLTAWGACFDGQLSMLTDPERLDDIEAAVSAAAEKLAELDDAAGEAKAQTVRAVCLARLGRIGDAETALDQALTAARHAREHRRVNNVLANAPLAALWGPNPVPRAGGRCLDVVRLLRITTGSPVVEATSTRCQGVLDAFRGRAAAGRRLIDSARRTLTELGMRHALLEVEQFAGIVELVADDPAAAEPHLRRACDGFRRMGLDADTAETAALLARTCLALDRGDEADELCTESERLAGHALKASIAWRTVRAQLLARNGDPSEAKRMAEEAVSIAGGTDLLVDHGDACLTLATVLFAAGDVAGARTAAEKAVGLYEAKGAAALVEKARGLLGERKLPTAAAPPEDPAVHLDNACMRVARQLDEIVDRQAWSEYAALCATNIVVESRRKVVGVDLPTTDWASTARRFLESDTTTRHTALAVRGERLALTRVEVRTTDASPGAPKQEVLGLYGLDEEGRVGLAVWFDIDDMDAAVAELDARYAQLEAEHPQVALENAATRADDRFVVLFADSRWDEISGRFAPDVHIEDRRRGLRRESNDHATAIAEIQAIAALGVVRVVSTPLALRGDHLCLSRQVYEIGDALPDPFGAEALTITEVDTEGVIVARTAFDVDDIDAAVAELDARYAELEANHAQTSLENAASHADHRFNALFADRSWDEIGALLTGDIHVEDRRRGLRWMTDGRAGAVAHLQEMAKLGAERLTSTVVAIRGQHLALVRTLHMGPDRQADAFQIELIRLAQVDANGRIVAHIAFDTDDIDAAIAELDARYLAGEAAPYAQRWQKVMDTLGALNRHEPRAVLGDITFADHRRVPFVSDDVGRAIVDLWALVPDARYRASAVHALDANGAVVSVVFEGTDANGDELQWVRIISWDFEHARVDVYDVDDLADALARFAELQPERRPRLENAASRAVERYLAYFPKRDWDAIAQVLAEDVVTDDRRRTVNAGIRRGREAPLADMQAGAVLGGEKITAPAVATRGEHLALCRVRSYNRSMPDEVGAEMLGIAELNGDNQLAAFVMFDLDDMDAAFEELDARYLAGEAAACAQTWSVIKEAYAAINRRELVATTPDWTSRDHRRAIAFEPGELLSWIRATWDDMAPDFTIRIEAVHRLTEAGTVVTHTGWGTSQEGFGAEWRIVSLVTVDGSLINRGELYDEADLDVALARFEDLTSPVRRLQNVACGVAGKYLARFAPRDWDAMAEMLADDFSADDRRHVVNAGVRSGRAAEIANLQAIAEIGCVSVTSTPIATRGDRLALVRDCFTIPDSPEPLQLEVIDVIEIDADSRIAAYTTFDANDIKAAVEELDARYLAGEGAAHARIWSVVMASYAMLNRHELPATTSDWASIDHRRAIGFAPGAATAAQLLSAWDVAPDLTVYIEAVHRLSDLGAVFTHAAYGTSPDGVEAEWRMIALAVFNGERDGWSELFDESDLDTALAKFDELSQRARRLQNAASRAVLSYLAHFTARDWDALAEVVAEGIVTEDRRRVVGAGIRSGRELHIADMRAAAEVGGERTTAEVIATRGERLVLSRIRTYNRATSSDEFGVEMLGIAELDADGRIALLLAIDGDDLDTALGELDARYLAGEGAAHSRVWSVIARGYAGLNQRELPPHTADLASIDHRRGASAFAPGDLTAYISAIFDLANIGTYVEAVHRLTDLGVVVTHVGRAASPEGFDAEWRLIVLVTLEGDLISRAEFFDEDDLDAALSRFDELSRPVDRLDNSATRFYKRFETPLESRDWEAVADLLAENACSDDRRRIVNAGLRKGRDAVIAEISALRDIGLRRVAADAMAIRGERLALSRVRTVTADQGHDAFYAEAIDVIEMDTEDRIVARVVFDLDDIDAAFNELDARYLAGEAARYADAWLVVARTYAALNQRKLPATTPDWINVDHRHGFGFAPGDLSAYTHASWDLSPDLTVYIEAVHQIARFGAVVTHTAYGTTADGFAAEWRGINVLTVEGELINRWEVFDESDIEAALSRFDELGRRTPRLENAASRTYDRFNACLTARDWDAMAEMIADDDVNIDRRRVVNTGVLRGREAQIENLRVIVDVGATNHESTVVAIRGDRLVLTRTSWSGSSRPGAFGIELLAVVEIDDNDRIAAGITFDLDDIDAAFNELETRYLAGEAAADASAWSLVTSAYAALNRHEFPATVPNWVNLDHRRVTGFAPGEMIPWIRAAWEIAPDLGFHIVEVHRLTNRGSVITHEAYGTSQEGFDAEWRTILLLTFEADSISRCETFDETDLALALAKYDELETSGSRLENAASRTYDRVNACLTARDWDAIREMIAHDARHDDRRRVVNAGDIRGRDAQIANLRAIIDVGAITHNESTVIATRGEHLALTRTHVSGSSEHAVAWSLEILAVVEVDSDHRLATGITFDVEDIDLAFAELDARYLAGEAAAHTNTWSVVTGAYTAFNRRELFTTTPDWVSIDHRRGTTVGPGDLKEFVRASWDDMRDVRIYIEAVHRLSDIGAVATSTSHGTSRDGFDAEWREIAVTTVNGDMVSRSELFDATDLDAALARFDELQTTVPTLENAASRASNRFAARFAARDLNAMAEMLTDDFSNDDRRRTVNTGTRHGRDAEIVNQRTLVDLGFTRMTSIVIATRGEHLVLTQSRIAFDDDRPDAFAGECLQIVEIDSDERFVALLVFDVDDTDAAFQELDGRYLVGETGAHAHTWEVVGSAIAAFNRGELPARTPNFVFVDHRQFAIIEAGALAPYAQAAWEQTPDLAIRVESVHLLSGAGSVFAISAHGTSQDGFDAEWRMIELLMVEGDLVNRIELFDEGDLDVALARFDELSSVR